jgi:AraC-like DNA-binding protein
MMSAELVSFSRFKYGRELTVDASACPAWTGIVPNGCPHALDFHELLLIERGTAFIDLNGEKLRVAGPLVLRTSPGEVRRVEVQDPLRLRLVVFADDAVQRFGGSAALARLPRSVAVRPSDREFSRLCDLADLIAAEVLRPMGDSPLMLDALLAQLLVRLGRHGRDGAGERPPSLLVRLERLIEARFREEHRVSAYAALLGVTPDHLSAVIRGHQRQGAKQVIAARVMREAAHLLRTSDVRVADLAAALGYRDTGHFTRAFTRVMGIAPGRYRSGR